MLNLLPSKFIKFVSKTFAIFFTLVIVFNITLLDISKVLEVSDFVVHADGPVPGNDCDSRFNNPYVGFNCYIRGVYKAATGWDSNAQCTLTNKITYSNGHNWNFCDPSRTNYTDQEVIIHVQWTTNGKLYFNIIEFVNYQVHDVPPSDPNLINPQGGWNLGPAINGVNGYIGIVNCNTSGVGQGCNINFNIIANDPDFFSGNGVNGFIDTNITFNNITNPGASFSYNHHSTTSPDNFTDNMTLSDGLWSWSARSTDNYGKASNSVSRQFFIDTTAPSQPVISTMNAFTKGLQNTPISSTSVDNGIGGVQYEFQRADDAAFNTNVQSSGSINWINASNFSFGSLIDNHKYYYRVHSKDSLNNVSNWSNITSSTQDATPPAIASVNIDNLKFGPKAGTIKTSTTTVNYSDLNLDSFQIDIIKALDNSVVRTYSETGINVTSKVSSFTWDGKDSANNFVADGGYNIKVSVTDKAGNQTVDPSKFVIVKNTPANISISNPSDGSWFNTPTITINGQTDSDSMLNIKRCSDLACITPIENRHVILNNVGIFKEVFNINLGENIIEVTALDPVGNINTKVFKYYKDTSLPTIQSIRVDSKQTNILINNQKPSISLNFNDTGSNINGINYISGIDPTKTYLSITHAAVNATPQSELILVNNGTNVQPQLGNIVQNCNTQGSFGNSGPLNCTYSFVFNNSLQPDGIYTIKANITDKSGNKSIDYINTFELDSHIQNSVDNSINKLYNYSQIQLKGTAEKSSTLQITGLSDSLTFLVDTSSNANPSRLTVNNCKLTQNPDTDGIKQTCDWSINSFQLKKNTSPGSLANPITFKLTDLAGNIDSKTLTPNIDLYAVTLGLTTDLQYFSPNGDGFQDGINFQNMATSGVVSSWKLEIRNPKYPNGVAKLITGNSSLPINYPWDGKDNNNVYVVDGDYQYQLFITTTDNLIFSTPIVTITAVTKINGNVVITFPGNNSYTTKGVTNVQGQAPSNTTLRICDSVIGLSNNCDFDYKNNITVDSNGFFSTVIPLYRLQNQNITQHYLIATATDKYGNVTPNSNKVLINVTNQTPFQSVAVIPAYVGVNDSQTYQALLKKINCFSQSNPTPCDPITANDISNLRSVDIQSSVSQGTERVKISFANDTNLKQLPVNQNFSYIGYTDATNKTYLNSPYVDGTTPTNICNTTTCTWDFYYPIPPVGGGLYEINLDGKLGPTIQTETASFTIDGNIPAIPLILAIDKVVNGQDQITNPFQGKSYSNNENILIKGISDPNANITVKDQNNNLICTTLTNSIGFWTCQLNVANIPGYSNVNTQAYQLNLTVSATLGKNTTNASSPKILVIDKIPPKFNSLNTSNIWHKSGDTVDVSLKANKELFYAINIDHDPGLNCINAPLQQNSFSDLILSNDFTSALGSYTIPGYAIEGRYCTQVEIQDIAGNRTDTNLVVNVDNTIPNIPTIDTSTFGIYSGINAKPNYVASGRLNPGYVIKDSTVTISGYAEENMLVDLFANQSFKGEVKALNHLQTQNCIATNYPDPKQSQQGTPYQSLIQDRSFDGVITEYQYQCPYSFNFAFDSGEIGYDFQIKAKDLSGNISLISDGTIIYYDKTPPITPQTTSVTSNGNTINDWRYATNQDVKASALGIGNFGSLPITNKRNINVKDYGEPLSDMLYTAVDKNGNSSSQYVKQKNGSGYDTRDYSLNSGDGVYSFYSQSWDAPGNQSGLHMFQVELDTIAPNTPNVSIYMSDTYHIGMSVYGEAGAFSTVGKLSRGGSASGSVKTLDINNDDDWNHDVSFCSSLTDRAGNSSGTNCSSTHIPIRPVRPGECNLTDSIKQKYNDIAKGNTPIDKNTNIYTVIGLSQSCQVYSSDQLKGDLTALQNNIQKDQTTATDCLQQKLKDNVNPNDAANQCHLSDALGNKSSNDIIGNINAKQSTTTCIQDRLKEGKKSDEAFSACNASATLSVETLQSIKDSLKNSDQAIDDKKAEDAKPWYQKLGEGVINGVKSVGEGILNLGKGIVEFAGKTINAVVSLTANAALAIGSLADTAVNGGNYNDNFDKNKKALNEVAPFIPTNNPVDDLKQMGSVLLVAGVIALAVVAAPLLAPITALAASATTLIAGGLGTLGLSAGLATVVATGIVATTGALITNTVVNTSISVGVSALQTVTTGGNLKDFGTHLSTNMTQAFCGNNVSPSIEGCVGYTLGSTLSGEAMGFGIGKAIEKVGSVVADVSKFAKNVNEINQISNEIAQTTNKVENLSSEVSTIEKEANQVSKGINEIDTNTSKVLKNESTNVADTITCPPEGCGLIDSNGNALCFVEGTLVSTIGGYRQIQNIQVGDKVLSRDPITGVQGYKRVIRTYTNFSEYIRQIKTSNGIIKSTPDHVFWAEDIGWTKAKDLKVGMNFINSDGNKVIINEVETIHSPQNVYNFEVEDYHTYFVGTENIWTHNKCGPNNLQDEVKSLELNKNDFTDSERVSFRQSEKDAEGLTNGAQDQMSYKGKNTANYGDKGSVRPDYYDKSTNTSYEVKNYSLKDKTGMDNLVNNAKKQIPLRELNLPENCVQKYIIDVRGQKLYKSLGEIQKEFSNRAGVSIENIQFITK